jgi:hypothetical protein
MDFMYTADSLQEWGIISLLVLYTLYHSETCPVRDLLALRIAVVSRSICTEVCLLRFHLPQVTISRGPARVQVACDLWLDSRGRFSKPAGTRGHQHVYLAAASRTPRPCLTLLPYGNKRCASHIALYRGADLRQIVRRLSAHPAGRADRVSSLSRIFACRFGTEYDRRSLFAGLDAPGELGPVAITRSRISIGYDR